MLRKAKDVLGCRLEASDGEIGKVKDLYFDDETWLVRYLVVDTGTWLNSREVLVSPISVTGIDPVTQIVMTSLNRSQVEKSPPAESDMPVSRVYERRLHNYYGWPYYWAGAPFGGPGLYVYPPAGDLGIYPDIYGKTDTPESQIEKEARKELEDAVANADPHLCSCKTVRGYHVQATDGEIGHVHDLLMDDGSWRFTHFVIDTRNWLPSKKVVVDTGVIEHLDWTDEEVVISLDKAALKDSPLYDPDMLIDETFQTQVSSYYRSLSSPRPPVGSIRPDGPPTPM